MEQEDNTTMTLSEIINKSKDKKGWTLKQLAQVSGASEYACSNAINGRPVHRLTVQRIGKALNIPEETLWTAERPRQTRTTKESKQIADIERIADIEQIFKPATPIQMDLFTPSVASLGVCGGCGHAYLVVMTPAHYCPVCGKEVSR